MDAPGISPVGLTAREDRHLAGAGCAGCEGTVQGRTRLYTRVGHLGVRALKHTHPHARQAGVGWDPRHTQGLQGGRGREGDIWGQQHALQAQLS